MNTILIQLDTLITQHVKISNKTVLQAHKYLCRLIHLKMEDQRLKDADLSIYMSPVSPIFHIVSTENSCPQLLLLERNHPL